MSIGVGETPAPGTRPPSVKTLRSTTTLGSLTSTVFSCAHAEGTKDPGPPLRVTPWTVKTPATKRAFSETSATTTPKDLYMNALRALRTPKTLILEGITTASVFIASAISRSLPLKRSLSRLYPSVNAPPARRAAPAGAMRLS
ncbi:hypothetical protein EDD55_104226 [Varunaivibrio sulfuroxidans]|uniref:Uncharacterized protein n=1 Tax=Varunaivibrio sulfuroxidans TaxID=1773489 RepID=A0A4R3JDA4_9PROT|nr:hypothetical protein EDD55_104226 [Varunaivibrio sulfuroxidans]